MDEVALSCVRNVGLICYVVTFILILAAAYHQGGEMVEG